MSLAACMHLAIVMIIEFTDCYICMQIISVADASIEITLPDGPISVGGLAILKCTVSGAVEVSNFTWHYNGTLIMEQQDPLITIEHDKNVGTLSIHEIPINEAGNYTCMAYASNDSTSLQVSYMLDLQGKQVYAFYVCIYT